jgi:hypothetical protein
VMFDLIFFFLMCSLMVDRKVTNFCMVILHPANVPKEFRISNSFQ